MIVKAYYIKLLRLFLFNIEMLVKCLFLKSHMHNIGIICIISAYFALYRTKSALYRQAKKQPCSNFESLKYICYVQKQIANMKNKTVNRTTSGMQINSCSKTLQKQNRRSFYSVKSLQYNCGVMTCFVQPVECGFRSIQPSIDLIDSEIKSNILSINSTEDKVGAVLSSIDPTEDKAEAVLSSIAPTEDKSEAVLSSIDPTEDKVEAVSSSIDPTEDKAEAVSSSIDPMEDKAEAISSSVDPKEFGLGLIANSVGRIDCNNRLNQLSIEAKQNASRILQYHNKTEVPNKRTLLHNLFPAYSCFRFRFFNGTVKRHKSSVLNFRFKKFFQSYCKN